MGGMLGLAEAKLLAQPVLGMRDACNVQPGAAARNSSVHSSSREGGSIDNVTWLHGEGEGEGGDEGEALPGTTAAWHPVAAQFVCCTLLQ